MASQFNSAFNDVADKIVDFEELKKKVKENYKNNLSRGEKTVMTLTKPLSFTLGIGLAFNKAFRSGMYKDYSGGTYVNGATVQIVTEYANRFSLSKKFQAKINRLTVSAFEECKDHSDKLATGKIRPLSWI